MATAANSNNHLNRYKYCRLPIFAIPAKEKKVVSVEGKTDKELLYNFLEELVYIKDVDNLIFGKFKVGVSEQKLEAECSGSSLGEIGRANLRNDVKAITMHMFSVKKIAKGYEATVVVDI